MYPRFSLVSTGTPRLLRGVAILVSLDERPFGLPATSRSVHAGFNVNIFGVRTEDNEPAMPAPGSTRLGFAPSYRSSRKSVSQHSTDSSFVEVIPFPFHRHHR